MTDIDAFIENPGHRIPFKHQTRRSTKHELVVPIGCELWPSPVLTLPLSVFPEAAKPTPT